MFELWRTGLVLGDMSHGVSLLLECMDASGVLHSQA